MTATTETDRTRTPVRRGLFYCSPACSRRGLCTMAAYDLATIEARLLADRLGPGWEVRVHENLGWFYSVYRASGENVLTVHPRTTGEHIEGKWKVIGYSAELNHQWWQNADTPEEAVAGVAAAIRTEQEKLDAVLASVTSLTR